MFFRNLCYAVRVLHMFCLPQVPKRNADDDDDVPHVQPVMPTSSSYYNANGYRRREDDGSLVPYGKPPSFHPHPHPMSLNVLVADLVYHYYAAHRDLKPSNILIADDGKTPILTDFGSITRARITIKTKKDAMVQQVMNV